MKGATNTPSTNLYICDLPGNIDEATIAQVFGAYGTVVQHKLLPKPHSQIPTAAALVRYSTVDEAKWIVENVNGNIPQGLTAPVKINFNASGEGKGKGKEGGFGGVFGGKGYGKAADSWGAQSSPYDASPMMWGGSWTAAARPAFSIKALIRGLLEANALPGSENISNDINAIYVNNLPKDTEDADLYKIFAPFGAIAPKGVRVMNHPDGSCAGYGFVNYLESAPMQVAISTLNGTQMPNGMTLTVSVKQVRGPGSEGGKGW